MGRIVIIFMICLLVLIPIAFATPPEQPGFWPMTKFTLGFDSTPVVADIDNDGQFEIVVNAKGTVVVLRPDGSIFPGWDRPRIGDYVSPVAVGDVNGDGVLEIVAASAYPAENSGIYVFDSKGNILSGWPVKGSLSPIKPFFPVLADLDNDGAAEIITVAAAYKGNGQTLQRWGVLQYPTIPPPPAVADIDNDGSPEIIIVVSPKVYAFKANGTLIPGWGINILSSHAAPVIGDLNKDGNLEIIVNALGTIYVFNAKGTTLPGWPVSVPNKPLTSVSRESNPAIGDLDGDGTLEIVIQSHEQQAVYAFNYRGQIMPGWPVNFRVSTNSLDSDPVLGDIDGDGIIEVLIVSDQTASLGDEMYAYNADGVREMGWWPDRSWPVRVGEDIFTPTISDIDGDGQVEILCNSLDAIYCYDMGPNTYRPDYLDWPMFRANASRTGVYNSSSTVEPSPPVTEPLAIVYDFNDSNPGPWQPVGGVWEIKDGVYNAPAIDLLFHEYTEIGDRRDWRDYIVETKFKLVEFASGGRGAEVHLVFRRSKEGSYAVRVIDRNPDIHNWRIEYMSWTDGYAKYHEGLLTALNMQLSLNVWYGLRVRAIGNTFGVDFFDGSSWLKVGAFSDNELNYGGIGLGKAAAHVQFDDVKIYGEGIEDLPPPSERTLSITSTEASPGAKVTVQLSITNATGLAAGDIMVKYDASVITVGEVKGTELISGLNLIVNKDVPGEIKLPMAGMKGIPSGSGALVEIELTVSKDAKVGTETTLSFSDTEIYDESGAVIPVILENGVVKITQQGVKGDVNNDGKVRSNDAMLALRIAAGLMVPSDYQKWAADMNDDGKIRSNDAMLILRKAAGLAAPGKESIVSIGKTITIMLGEAHGVAGESITAPLMVDNVHQLASGDICIGYDPTVLRAVGVSSESDMFLANNIAESGMVRIAFASADKLNSKTIAEIRFDILTDDVSPLTLQRAELYQSDAIPIDSKKIDGKFSSWVTPPEHSVLLQNFPNPFNPETWIPYKLAQASEVNISIYDGKGQLVHLVYLGVKPAGVYLTKDRAVYWDGRNYQGERVAIGLYFYQLKAGDFNATRRMIIVK